MYLLVITHMLVPFRLMCPHLGSRKSSLPILMPFFPYEMGSQPGVWYGDWKEVRQGSDSVLERLMFCLVWI